MELLSLPQFLERVKKGLSVSRFKFALSFKWESEATTQLEKTINDLSSADLSSADLRSADLSSANLRYADLRYADLRYADLSSANLRYADLRYAVWVQPCGSSFAEIVKSLKDATPELVQYLWVQTIANGEDWKKLLPTMPAVPKVISVKKFLNSQNAKVKK